MFPVGVCTGVKPPITSPCKTLDWEHGTTHLLSLGWDPGIWDPGVRDPGVWNPGVWDPGAWDPGVWDLELVPDDNMDELWKPWSILDCWWSDDIGRVGCKAGAIVGIFCAIRWWLPPDWIKHIIKTSISY